MRQQNTEFEVFKGIKGGGRPTVTTPVIGFQRNTMSLNRAAYEALGSPDAVELLYARADRLVGIRASDPGVPHAYRVRLQGGTRMLTASAFFTYIGAHPVRQRMAATMSDGILTARLPDDA